MNNGNLIDGKKNIVTVYDGGSGFVSGKNFKWTFEIDSELDEMPE